MRNLSNAAEEDHFVMALHACARTWRLLLDRRLRHLKIGQSSWLAIALITRAPAPLSQRELADLVGIEGPSMVSMLDRLERDGFVIRVPSTSDRRVKLVQLTEAGHKVFAEVHKEGIAVRASILDGLDPQSLASTTELLETICHRIGEVV